MNENNKVPQVTTGGFTLVELMVTIAISGFIVAQIYLSYITQQKTAVAQERVAEMQQSLRATMYPLVQNIRMAGYNPTGNNSGAGIVQAKPGRIELRMDLNRDGDTEDSNERVRFGFAKGTDADSDGIPDDGNPAPLGIRRGNATGYQPIRDNIESFEFRYLDGDGNPTANPADIRTVQVSLLAITEKPDPNFTNRSSYNPASGENEDWKRATSTDHFRRELLITTVVCRNMGM